MSKEKTTKFGSNFTRREGRSIFGIALIFGLLIFGLVSGGSETVKVSASSQDAPESAVVIFSNSSPITINDNTTASPYPSTINVTGVDPAFLPTTVRTPVPTTLALKTASIF